MAPIQLVAGVAGLLKSFDPDLQFSELKEIVVNGSSRTNKRVAGRPFLNAYEALKYAAQRPGAPLCGNRVWSRDVYSGVYRVRGEVVAERDSASPPEVLISHEWISPGPLLTFHSGRRIDDFNTGFAFFYDPVSRTWEEDGTTWDHNFADGEDGGAWNSAYGVTHSGKWAVIANAPKESDGVTPTGELLIYRAPYSSSTMSAGTYTQVANVPIATNWLSASFNAPITTNGDTLYFALNRSSGGEYLGVNIVAGTTFTLFQTDTAGGVARHVQWFAFNEDLREMVTNELVPSITGIGYDGCEVLFRNMDASRRLANGSLVPLGAVLKRIEGSDCSNTYGGQTIAPQLSPLPRRK
jgi:hypothetical protein